MPAQSLADRIAALIAEAQPPPAPAPPAPASRLAYTLQDASAATGVGVTTFRREIAAGRLKAIKVRGRVLILQDELQHYLQALAQ